LAHLLIGEQGCQLFADSGRFDKSLAAKLSAQGFELIDYAEINNTLAGLPGDATVLIDPGRVVPAIVQSLPDSVQRIEAPNPSTAMKAVKTDGELAHIRATMRKDGAALVQAFHKIERGLAAGRSITELDVAATLHAARAAQTGFVSESFATIVGYLANGALPHYKPTPDNHATLRAAGLLLVDSGGQYVGGTTDITRVWAFGEITAEQRRDCTTVLKALIALSEARFPQGATGQQLDALARHPIWQAGADYGHGTGHGVGYFLNVHDGPQDIRPPHSPGPHAALQPGMVTSIEPGLYKPGRHGVRHENLTVVRREQETEFGHFLAFETVTLCPIDTRALEVSQLSLKERDWLNAYHARVEEELAPLLDDSDRAWLHERCKPLLKGH
jgi:Xaa-Pro aminopeptidase